MAAPSQIDLGDSSKAFYSADNYMDMRGVVDFGNLVQFAPYETGYCFLAVINGPSMMTHTQGTKAMQEAFIKVLEQEFKGLDGIDDITSENMDISDNINTLSLISKTNQTTNGQISMSFTEKTGTLLTKYISTFLRYLHDPKTQARTYGGYITADNADTAVGYHNEVFNMLYVVTDSTCLNVEKAFLMLNMQPTSAPYSSLFNADRGEISTQVVNINWNAFVVDGALPNAIAKKYIRALVNTTETTVAGKINVNSWNYDWSFADGTGEIKKISNLSVDESANKLTV